MGLGKLATRINYVPKVDKPIAPSVNEVDNWGGVWWPKEKDPSTAPHNWLGLVNYDRWCYHLLWLSRYECWKVRESDQKCKQVKYKHFLAEYNPQRVLNKFTP